MNYQIQDFGKLYWILVENELVFGFDRAIMSIKLDCRDFEYEENGIVLYGSEPNGLLRSRNVLTISDKPSFKAMHDGDAEIKPLGGSRMICSENGTAYSFTCINGENALTLTLDGNCRCEGNALHFRRGNTELRFSERTEVRVTAKRRGFDYEAEKCLSLIADNGELTSDSTLLPLLLLVNGLKNAEFDLNRAENVKTLLADMSKEDKSTADAVLHRYFRSFGKEKR